MGITRKAGVMAAAVAAFAVGVGVYAQVGSAPSAAIDKAVKDFNFPVIKDLKTGEAKANAAIKLSTSKEKVIVLCGMSQQCSVSGNYEKRLGAFLKKYDGNKQVKIVGLHVSANDTADSLTKWYDGKNLPITVVDDPNGDFTRFMAWKQTPSFAVLERDDVGKYNLRFQGGFDDSPDASAATKAYVPDAVAAILAGKPVVTKTARVFG